MFADASSVDLRFLREEDAVTGYLPAPLPHGCLVWGAAALPYIRDPTPLPYLNQVCTNPGQN
jgi:hypothetical protein